MGLLTALDFHRTCESGKGAGDSVEVEYRLQSWGEIFPPFLGDREHSIVARHILRDFPFKLFSMSTPYDGGLPQQLCLTFRAPHEVKKNTGAVHVSGIFPDEIAKEVAAFLSLVTRLRIFAVGQMRYDGLPLEQVADLYQHSHFQEKQRLKEISSDEIYRLLANLQTMDRRVAGGFVLAMRLYHSAVEMMYTEPEFSYLFLVACLEAISSVVNKGYRPNNEGSGSTELEEFLNSKFPGWKTLVDLSSNRDQLIKVLLASEQFTFRKLLKFLNENVPEKFWTETEDDAKLDFLTRVISRSSLEKVLHNVYDARSKLVHEGIRLPESIVIGHFRMVPSGAAEELLEISQKRGAKDNVTLEIPLLITFERLVSYSMVEFLGKQHE